ncbi:hypothetical protein Tco_1413494, partial [Tanacetum coccineum]
DYLSQKQFDKEKYLEEPMLAAPVAVAPNQPIPSADLTTYNGWVKNQEEVVVLIKTGTSTNRERISRVQQEEGQSVGLYVLKMKSYIDNLERLGHPVTLKLGVSLILIGLSKEYDSFVQNYKCTA